MGVLVFAIDQLILYDFKNIFDEHFLKILRQFNSIYPRMLLVRT